MGYTTEFSGKISIEPPLSRAEIDYLCKFASTRRMDRRNGPYFVDGTGYKGQGADSDIIDYNSPHPSQPSLWCQWVPTEDGKYLEWDGGEKFYNSVEWMRYLIGHFLRPNCFAAQNSATTKENFTWWNKLFFIQANHILNGTIHAQGESDDDRWTLIVQNNEVFFVEAVD